MNPNRPRQPVPTGLILFLVFASLAHALTLPTAANIRKAFNAVDANQNGVINAKEWDQASFALFRAIDKNNDDFIDREELQAANLAPDTFLRADLDGDQRLSVSEFTELRRALFNLADIDRTESLSLVEFELFILMERVGWVDSNRNGIIEMSELVASLLLAFSGLDSDLNSELSADEASFMRPEAFKRYDTNQDGKLSRDEFVQGYRNELMSG